VASEARDEGSQVILLRPLCKLDGIKLDASGCFYADEDNAKRLIRRRCAVPFMVPAEPAAKGKGPKPPKE
jgi:hypothetical protein